MNKCGRLSIGFALMACAAAQASEGVEPPNLFTGDLGNIIWTLATFIVVLIVLGKFAWKPILGGLQKREEFIRDSLEQARRDREEAEKRLAEYVRKVDAARAEATTIVEEGRREAEVLKRRLDEMSKTEAQATLERTRREIGIALESATKELYSLAGKLATEAASRIIRKEITPADHERLINESVMELEKVGRN